MNHQQQIIVAGAGIAGLTAAQDAIAEYKDMLTEMPSKVTLRKNITGDQDTV